MNLFGRQHGCCWCWATTWCSCISAGKASACARNLLIGFYYRTVANGNAAIKAFIVTVSVTCSWRSACHPADDRSARLNIQDLMALATAAFHPAAR